MTDSEGMKLATLTGVREHAEGDPVELWLLLPSGRVVVRCYNECHNNCTDLDLSDLLAWARTGAVGAPTQEGE